MMNLNSTQIEHVLEEINYLNNQKTYSIKDIKSDFPKTSCYAFLITENFENPQYPKTLYAYYDATKNKWFVLKVCGGDSAHAIEYDYKECIYGYVNN